MAKRLARYTFYSHVRRCVRCSLFVVFVVFLCRQLCATLLFSQNDIVVVANFFSPSGWIETVVFFVKSEPRGIRRVGGMTTREDSPPCSSQGFCCVERRGAVA